MLPSFTLANLSVYFPLSYIREESREAGNARQRRLGGAGRLDGYGLIEETTGKMSVIGKRYDIGEGKSGVFYLGCTKRDITAYLDRECSILYPNGGLRNHKTYVNGG